MKFLLMIVLILAQIRSSAGATASPCSDALDLGVVVDISKSVKLSNLPLLRTALLSLVNLSNISPDGTHMGLILFGGKAELRFNFSNPKFYKPDAIYRDISNIQNLTLGTLTYEALSLANSTLFTAAGGDRPDKPNVLLVFTDGKPTQNKNKIPGIIQLLEEKDVYMVAVGIGEGVEEDVLNDIKGRNGTLLPVSNFEDLSNSMTKVQDKMCGLDSPNSPTKVQDKVYELFACLIEEFRKNVTMMNISEPRSLENVINLTSKMLQTCINGSQNGSFHLLLLLLQVLEEFGVNYADKHLGKERTNVTRTIGEDLVWVLQKVPANLDEDAMFSFKNESCIKLPKTIFKGQERSITVLMFQDKAHQRLSQKLHNSVSNETVDAQLNSPIITVQVKPKVTGELDENITMLPRQYKSPGNKQRSHCAFWKFPTETHRTGSWSTQGCSFRNNTWACNHMTSFAILMQTDEIPDTAEGDKLALEVITYIGTSLSLLGEALSIIAYAVLLRNKHDDTQELHIRLNLVVSLAAAQITFLAGIDATDNEGVCIFVSLLLHYLFLVALDWMLVEGLSLYFKVVKVYNTDIKTSWYFVFAWGFPVLILVLSIIIASTSDKGVQSYTNPKFCWVSFTNGLIWTFVVPVIIIIVVNIVITVLVARAITRLITVGNEIPNDSRRAARASLFLCPLLGVPWIFGLLVATTGGLVFQYIFAILNASQGFLIFTFHTCRSTEIRAKFHQIRQTISSRISDTGLTSHPSKVSTTATKDNLGLPPNARLHSMDLQPFRGISMSPVARS